MNGGMGGFNLFLPKRKKYVSCLLKENMDQKQKKRSFPYKLYYNPMCVIVVFCEFYVKIGC